MMSIRINKPEEKKEECGRTRCEVWTRVMGYHRPVANYNIGKKSEHYSRKHFQENKCSSLCCENKRLAQMYS